MLSPFITCLMVDSEFVKPSNAPVVREISCIDRKLEERSNAKQTVDVVHLSRGGKSQPTGLSK